MSWRSRAMAKAMRIAFRGDRRKRRGRFPASAASMAAKLARDTEHAIEHEHKREEAPHD